MISSPNPANTIKFDTSLINMANSGGNVGMFNVVLGNKSSVYSAAYNINLLGPSDIG